MLSAAGLLPQPSGATDNYPFGAMAFFNLSVCPSGWTLATSKGGDALNGYFLVPFAPPVPEPVLGTTVNNALGVTAGIGEDRTHSHGFASSITLNTVSYAGIGGCCQKNVASSGDKPFGGNTSAASAGVPYWSLLLCEKTAYHRNSNPPTGVPPYVVSFFSSAYCPTGWKPTLASAGRLLVGLPTAGTPVASFGGDPLRISVQGNAEDRVHAHAFSGKVSTTSQNVMLAAGCCDSGYGANASYDFHDNTGSASSGLPYAVVIQCQACGPGDTDPACAGQ